MGNFHFPQFSQRIAVENRSPRSVNQLINWNSLVYLINIFMISVRVYLSKSRIPIFSTWITQHDVQSRVLPPKICSFMMLRKSYYLGVHTPSQNQTIVTSTPGRGGLVWISEGLAVQGQPVETTDKFRYLDCEICSEGHSSPDIHRRLGLAFSTFWPVRSCVAEERLNLKTKLRVYTHAFSPSYSTGQKPGHFW